MAPRADLAVLRAVQRRRALAAAADDVTNPGWASKCRAGTVAGEIADTEPELRHVTAEVSPS